MTHDRPFRRALSADHALRELWSEAGTQLDRDLVPLFALEPGHDDTRLLSDKPPFALLAVN